MAITDGETVVPLLPSQDHKRAFDGDRGPNTGGMGAYTPVPILPPDIAHTVVETIIRPAIEAVRDLGIPYRGVLYAGVMVTADGPKCIEFNCRFGDPEAQAVLPMLASDLVPLLTSVSDCTLDQVEARWREGAAVCVVAASGGYPEAFDPGKNIRSLIGKPISGLERAAQSEGCLVFHAGTRLQDGQVVSDGGRVLTLTGLGASLSEAAARAYAGLSHVQFDGIHYRRDIAVRALQPQ
jgi:phosphoribosylamine--glycine ligase